VTLSKSTTEAKKCPIIMAGVYREKKMLIKPANFKSFICQTNESRTKKRLLSVLYGSYATFAEAEKKKEINKAQSRGLDTD
jgi:hypothetical protein